MKLYTIDITIHNDFGELVEKRLCFPTLDDMNIAFWKHNVIDSLIDEARQYATENNMVIEEMDKDEIDGDYEEDLSPTSPLNNPANFAN